MHFWSFVLGTDRGVDLWVEQTTSERPNYWLISNPLWVKPASFLSARESFIKVDVSENKSPRLNWHTEGSHQKGKTTIEKRECKQVISLNKWQLYLTGSLRQINIIDKDPRMATNLDAKIDMNMFSSLKERSYITYIIYICAYSMYSLTHLSRS